MKTLQELREARWNGKVYGRREYNSCNVYLDGNKVLISNEEADYLESLDENEAVWYKFDKLANLSNEDKKTTSTKKEEKRTTKKEETKLKKIARTNNIPYWADEQLSECYGY